LDEGHEVHVQSCRETALVERPASVHGLLASVP
jgi:hypothetical protein